MDTLNGIWTVIYNFITMFGIADILDIALVTLAIYYAISFIFRTHYRRFAISVIVIGLCVAAANWMKLPTISYFAGKGLELGLIALVIIFQPELRRLLERLGSTKLMEMFGTTAVGGGMESAITQTTLAYKMLSESKTGALIVFERATNLSEFTNTGTVLNADITRDLIRNIFFEPAPLHDGAVIIREGKIAAAGCMLPLSKNNTLSQDMGMRHRAAIGISEVSDAVVAIVSEETGAISVAVNGMIKRHLDIETFEAILRAELLRKTEEVTKPMNRINHLFGTLKGK